MNNLALYMVPALLVILCPESLSGFSSFRVNGSRSSERDDGEQIDLSLDEHVDQPSHSLCRLETSVCVAASHCMVQGPVCSRYGEICCPRHSLLNGPRTHETEVDDSHRIMHFNRVPEEDRTHSVKVTVQPRYDNPITYRPPVNRTRFNERRPLPPFGDHITQPHNPELDWRSHPAQLQSHLDYRNPHYPLEFSQHGSRRPQNYYENDQFSQRAFPGQKPSGSARLANAGNVRNDPGHLHNPDAGVRDGFQQPRNFLNYGPPDFFQDIDALRNLNSLGKLLLQKHRYLGQCGVRSALWRQPSIGRRLESLNQPRFGQEPWMAVCSGHTLEGPFIGCSAVVIHDSVLLTSASCITKLATEPKVEAGLRHSSEHVILPPIKRHVNNVILHEGFNPYSGHHDMSLLILQRPLPFQTVPNIAPICLPHESQSFSPKNCTLTSWDESSVNPGYDQWHFTTFDDTYSEDCAKANDGRSSRNVSSCFAIVRGCLKGNRGTMLCRSEHSVYLAGQVVWSNNRCDRDGRVLVNLVNPYTSWIKEIVSEIDEIRSILSHPEIEHPQVPQPHLEAREQEPSRAFIQLAPETYPSGQVPQYPEGDEDFEGALSTPPSLRGVRSGRRGYRKHDFRFKNRTKYYYPERPRRSSGGRYGNYNRRGDYGYSYNRYRSPRYGSRYGSRYSPRRYYNRGYDYYDNRRYNRYGSNRHRSYYH